MDRDKLEALIRTLHQEFSYREYAKWNMFKDFADCRDCGDTQHTWRNEMEEIFWQKERPKEIKKEEFEKLLLE